MRKLLFMALIGFAATSCRKAVAIACYADLARQLGEAAKADEYRQKQNRWSRSG